MTRDTLGGTYERLAAALAASGIDGGGAVVTLSRADALALLEGRRPQGPKPVIDRDYDNRRGYDAKFLPAGDVPFPALTAAQEADAGPGPIPYHHFSIVMTAERRLARFTAANIDGKRLWPIERYSPDPWTIDERVGDLQTGNDLYKGNPLDRGHLVRRIDPAWGDTHEEALSALADTFHYTNSAPQHHEFNAGELLWLGLETYVLANAGAHDLRVTVFCGPVLDDEDHEYRGVLIPRQYWKVLVVGHPEGGLSSTAYLLSQQEKLVGGLEASRDGWIYGSHLSFQKRVTTIEELTSLDFGALRDVDAIDRPGIAAVAREDEPLTSFADIVL